jgi:hypothetical protein
MADSIFQIATKTQNHGITLMGGTFEYFSVNFCVLVFLWQKAQSCLLFSIPVSVRRT